MRGSLGDYSGWLFKLGGLLATGLAAAQGAPFWFDILKKIVNIRTSGVNPFAGRSLLENPSWVMRAKNARSSPAA